MAGTGIWKLNLTPASVEIEWFGAVRGEVLECMVEHYSHLLGVEPCQCPLSVMLDSFRIFDEAMEKTVVLPLNDVCRPGSSEPIPGNVVDEDTRKVLKEKFRHTANSVLRGISISSQTNP
jgi:hypothetical protein